MPVRIGDKRLLQQMGPIVQGCESNHLGRKRTSCYQPFSLETEHSAADLEKVVYRPQEVTLSC